MDHVMQWSVPWNSSVEDGFIWMGGGRKRDGGVVEGFVAEEFELGEQKRELVFEQVELG